MKKYTFFVIVLLITIISCEKSIDFNSWQKDIINSFSKGQTFTYLVNDTDTVSFIVTDIIQYEDRTKSISIALQNQEEKYKSIQIYLLANADDYNEINININDFYYFVSSEIKKGINYPYKGNKIPTIYFLTNYSYETSTDSVIIKPNTGIIHVVFNSNMPLTMDLLGEY